MPRTEFAARDMPDTYFALVKEFPLAPIRDTADLHAAQSMLDRLLQDDLDEGGDAYLDVLTGLVNDYEEEHYPIPDAPESDVLRHLLDANGLTQVDLARAVGMAASTVSAVLKGTRSLTKSQVVKVSSFFNVSPAVFLPATKR